MTAVTLTASEAGHLARLVEAAARRARKNARPGYEHLDALRLERDADLAARLRAAAAAEEE